MSPPPNKPASHADKNMLKQFFATWQQQQLKAGRFWAEDSCNGDWFSKHTVPDSLSWIYGFPSDSLDYSFSFADLNGDRQTDGLVTFTPDLCGGGNGAMWVQWQVFLLSGKGRYEAIDTIEVRNYASTAFDDEGFYWLDSIAPNKIFGTYIQFNDSDGHCCPGINRPVTFDFAKRELISAGETKKRE